MNTIAIIGAGASGIVAALASCQKNKVFLIDSNNKCGKKILLTGNGRCNYWNSHISVNEYQTDNEPYLKEILSHQNEVLDYLTSLGIYPKIKNNYYYPYSNEASSVQKIFENAILNSNIIWKSNSKVTSLSKKDNEFMITINHSETIKVSHVIIASGSKAYPITGSDGSSYALLSKLGHTIHPVLPSLVPLLSNNPITKEWANIRCEGKVSLYINHQNIKQEQGEIQLTKQGISGICIFNLSGLAAIHLHQKDKVSIHINFFPTDTGFYQWFTKRSEELKDLTIVESLETVFDYRLLHALLKESFVVGSKKWAELTEKEKLKLCQTIEDYELVITATESFDRSQVCTGGIPLSEINPENMESKIIPHLYLIGELLDVDGICGGFNLSFAFITGYLAGKNVL